MAGTLNILKGDLWESNYEVIVNAVNTRGKFAKGFAAQVRKRFPDAYRAYMRKYEKGLDSFTESEGWKLGDVQVVMTGDWERYVANIATQDRYGSDGKQYVDYDAVTTCLTKLFDICVVNNWKVCMPRIGCGLGGGDWKVIETIIRDLLMTRDIVVEVYTQ